MTVFNDQEQGLIRAAIEVAETQSSGEMRVCVEKTCSEHTLDRAARYFQKLGLEQTVQRNGVLIYLAVEDHKFAIIGDIGINKVVPSDFWDTTKEVMRGFFRKGQIVEGVVAGIQMAGEKLKTYFPPLSDDKNELPDDIVHMDGQ